MQLQFCSIRYWIGHILLLALDQTLGKRANTLLFSCDSIFSYSISLTIVKANQKIAIKLATMFEII